MPAPVVSPTPDSDRNSRYGNNYPSRILDGSSTPSNTWANVPGTGLNNPRDRYLNEIASHTETPGANLDGWVHGSFTKRYLEYFKQKDPEGFKKFCEQYVLENDPIHGRTLPGWREVNQIRDNGYLDAQRMRENLDRLGVREEHIRDYMTRNNLESYQQIHNRVNDRYNSGNQNQETRIPSRENQELRYLGRAQIEAVSNYCALLQKLDPNWQPSTSEIGTKQDAWLNRLLAMQREGKIPNIFPDNAVPPVTVADRVNRGDAANLLLPPGAREEAYAERALAESRVREESRQHNELQKKFDRAKLLVGTGRGAPFDDPIADSFYEAIRKLPSPRSEVTLSSISNRPTVLTYQQFAAMQSSGAAPDASTQWSYQQWSQKEAGRTAASQAVTPVRPISSSQGIGETFRSRRPPGASSAGSAYDDSSPATTSTTTVRPPLTAAEKLAYWRSERENNPPRGANALAIHDAYESRIKLYETITRAETLRLDPNINSQQRAALEGWLQDQKTLDAAMTSATTLLSGADYRMEQTRRYNGTRHASANRADYLMPQDQVTYKAALSRISELTERDANGQATYLPSRAKHQTAYDLIEGRVQPGTVQSAPPEPAVPQQNRPEPTPPPVRPTPAPVQPVENRTVQTQRTPQQIASEAYSKLSPALSGSVVNPEGIAQTQALLNSLPPETRLNVLQEVNRVLATDLNGSTREVVQGMKFILQHGDQSNFTADALVKHIRPPALDESLRPLASRFYSRLNEAQGELSVVQQVGTEISSLPEEQQEKLKELVKHALLTAKLDQNGRRTLGIMRDALDGNVTQFVRINASTSANTLAA